MNILSKIKNSIYSPDYYKELINKPFSYSFKFLLVFALFFALVFTVVITVMSVPLIKTFSEKAPQLVNYFPEELKITIKDGVVSTNVSEPYFVKMPEEWKNNEYLNSSNATINDRPAATVIQLDNIIVIDTKNKFDIEAFKSYKTFILLSSNSIAYMDDNGKVAINSLSEVKEFSLDRGVVVDIINKLTPFLNIFYPAIFIGAYIVGYIIVLTKMFYLLFGALLVWLVARTKGIKIGYKKSYQLGMHLIIPGVIIVSILSAFPQKLTFTFLFSVLLIIFAWVNLKKQSI